MVARGKTVTGGDVLLRIKRAVLTGRYAFSETARIEMEIDGLTELDIAESILNAVAIYKTVRLALRADHIFENIFTSSKALICPDCRFIRKVSLSKKRTQSATIS